MSDDNPFDLFSVSEAKNEPPEFSVSEISQKLKKLVEGNFSHVRVRGELSRVTVAKSGHMYSSLKDDKSVIDAICWKGTMSRLTIKPEEGMEVVCTGRLTTYPGRSNYQIVIEHMELAGQGALLKMLEDRRKKLATEGLFDPKRKKAIPFIPKTIGVITSPTGAVIRDIMHRLNERFPTRVLLYPVIVQGKGAAAAVAEATKKFNTIPEDSGNRPDVLIIARGGGSIEDLMPFNDEAVVRAVAESDIPVISAVGHETDTTLVDYAADLRAPTPTAAAEKAVPVRSELRATVMDSHRRMLSATTRLVQQRRTHLEGLVRGIGDPKRMLETYAQRIDHVSSKLDNSLRNWLNQKSIRLNKVSAKITPHNLTQNIKSLRRITTGYKERLNNASEKIMLKHNTKVENLNQLLESFSFTRVLERGYAVISDEKGTVISSKTQLPSNEKVTIRIKDGEKKATID